MRLKQIQHQYPAAFRRGGTGFEIISGGELFAFCMPSISPETTDARQNDRRNSIRFDSDILFFNVESGSELESIQDIAARPTNASRQSAQIPTLTSHASIFLPAWRSLASVCRKRENSIDAHGAFRTLKSLESRATSDRRSPKWDRLKKQSPAFASSFSN